MSASSSALGRYLLYDEIAAGGMATLHLGRLIGPAGFSRTVAIKRLHPHLAKDPEFVAMFLDEARLAARIRHPNVVPTLDVVASSGEVFLVMDYVHGESLARLCRTVREREEAIPLPILCAIMANVLAGLHAAHEAKSDQGDPLGIVHRDVSPQNLIVGVDGIARLLDFGVAKAVLRYQSTHEGQLKGKLAYMAPEQVQLRPVDRRSDVFAASIVFWEALTGTRLFDTAEPAATVAKIAGGDIPPPSSLVPGLAHALDAVVLRGLERDPDRRFSTALEMGRALEVAAPSANVRQVGEWVESTAAAALSQRASRLAQVESESSMGRAAPSSSRGVELTPNRSEAPTEVSVSLALEPPNAVAGSFASSPRPPRRLGRILAFASLSALTVVAGLVVRHRPTAIVASPPAPSNTPLGLDSDAVPTPSPLAAAIPSPMVSVASSLPSASASSPALAPSHPIKLPARPRAPSCQPGFSVDDRGIKHFKPECLPH